MLKIGDFVDILTPRIVRNENEKYRKHKVISIVKKQRYNMYICEDLETKIKTTITDMDIVTSKYSIESNKEYKNSKNPVIRL